MNVKLVVGLLLAAGTAQGEVDWARKNIAACEHAKTPIRAGVPGVRPFWNAHAKAFIHPPAFEFQEVDGSAEYRFTLERADPGRAGRPRPAETGRAGRPRPAETGRAGRPRPADTARPEAAPYHSWTASKPWLPIPADIWDSLPPGYYTLKVESLGEATLLSLPATERSGKSAASPKKSCECTFYRAAALAIARTYAKLQGADGTWPLKVREKDGSPVRANRLVPGRYILGLFDRSEQAAETAAPHVFAQTRDRAFAYLLDGPVKTWNWDGQFEDMDPMPPYKNLQKGAAVDTALRLFAQGRVAEGCELVWRAAILAA